jgi:hypothetical protein
MPGVSGTWGYSISILLFLDFSSTTFAAGSLNWKPYTGNFLVNKPVFL